jgi:hypothetical protein
MDMSRHGSFWVPRERLSVVPMLRATQNYQVDSPLGAGFKSLGSEFYVSQARLQAVMPSDERYWTPLHVVIMLCYVFSFNSQ